MNILLLCNNYGRPTSANGICVKNISNAIQRVCPGSNVFCVSPRPMLTNGDKTTIYEVRPNLSSNPPANVISKLLFKLYSFFRHINFVLFYPNNNFLSYKREMLKKANTIIRDENIDMVVAFYGPIEPIKVLLKIKKTHKIMCVAYFLDLVTEYQKSNRITSRIFLNKGKRYLFEVVKKVDKVLLPLNSYSFVSNKIHYVAHPVYVKSDYVDKNITLDHDCINISYVGTLNKNNRDIAPFLHILSTISNDIHIKFNVWGRLDSYTEELLKDYSDIVVYGGILNNESVSCVFSQSDFLLNVSNKNARNMIPSKLFQMFSSNKHIINFSFFPNYVERELLNQYPEVIEILDMQYDIADIKQKIVNYCLHDVSFNDEIFSNYKPEYHARLLLGFLD